MFSVGKEESEIMYVKRHTFLTIKQDFNLSTYQP